MEKFKSLETMEEKQKFITDLEATSKWKKNGKASATGFADSFWKTYYLQVHAPVFPLHVLSSDADIDLINPSTYSVTFEPLNPLPANTSEEEWGEMIGFGCPPSSLFQSNPKDVFRMKCWGKHERVPQELPFPTLHCEPHYEVPHESYLN